MKVSGDTEVAMPAQSLTERSAKGVMGLPANDSTVALMRKVDKQSGGLEVEFSGGERSEHVTPRQWITVAVLVYVNLINYMDRLTLAGETTLTWTGALEFPVRWLVLGAAWHGHFYSGL